jgi:hypothetical protein
VVLQSPELKGVNLKSTGKVWQGAVPEKGSDVSVFIVVIGMPRTPYSYAGVARRSYGRVYWR